MSASPASPLPQGWDFDPEFLSCPEYLPPYIRRHESPILGPSARPTATQVQRWLRSSSGAIGAANTSPLDLGLPLVHAIVDDREAQRYRVQGPATLCLPESHLDRHLLLVGPPGTGKTTQGIQPLTAQLLANRERSVVVFDAKSDQHALVRELALASGRSARSVVRLNLSDPRGSIGWNPLRAGLDHTEASAIATSLVLSVEGEHGQESPFWRNKSIELLTDILLGLARDQDEVVTLPRLHEILSLPRKDLLAWLQAHGAHRFASFLTSGAHNAETCLADAQMRLLWAADLDLCAVISHGELQLDDLFRKPMVLVIEMDETRTERQKPIFNMLCQQILDRAIQKASQRPTGQLPFPVSIVIDEFGSAVGAIPRFPKMLNTLRSRRVSVIAAVQGLAQIQALYRHDAGSVIGGFGSKWFFPNVELADAEFASAMAGTMTVSLPRGEGVPFALISRRVYLPEEIRRPIEHPVLGRPVTMLLADSVAMQVYLTPSFRQPSVQAAWQAQQGKRKRPRRRQPLVYRPRGAAETEYFLFTDTRQMGSAKVVQALLDAERRADLASAPHRMRSLYGAWSSKPLADYKDRLRFVEELLSRAQTFASASAALLECKAREPKVALAYLDYVLLRDLYEDAPEARS